MAAHAGSSVAAFVLSQELAFRDKSEQAFQFALAAAEGGLLPGMCLVAEHLSEGWGVPRNIEEARRWHARAAELGCPEAYYWLGNTYQKDDGTFTNESAARALFETAVELGVSDAEYSLGIMMLDFSHNSSDFKSGINYLKRCAERGHVLAAIKLSSIYSRGSHGAPVDLSMAAKYTNMANSSIDQE
jgi:hypothetical protein